MPSRCLVLLTVVCLLVAGCSGRAGKSSTTATKEQPKPDAPAPAKPSARKVDVAGLIERARQAINAGSPAAESLLGEALAADPTNRSALILLANATQIQAQGLSRPDSSPLYLRSGEAVHKLLATNPRLSSEERSQLGAILYNEACTYSIQGESARALKSLADAYSIGFSRLEILDNDVELDPLRQFPGFLLIQKAVEQRHVETLLASTKASASRFAFDLPDLDGKKVRAADLKGKVVLLNFWGTWCGPARKQIPQLVALDKRYRDKGLAVVGIAYENAEGEDAVRAVRAFAKESGIEFATLMGDQATQRQIPDFFGLPITLLLDRDGRVRYRATGYQPYSALETAVEALLDEGKKDVAPAKR